MKVLEQILQEIDKKIEEVEKIIVNPPADSLDKSANDTAEAFIGAYKGCQDIIRSHMEDDGWIPVAELLPEKTIETFDGVFSSEVVAVTIMNEEGELYRGCDFLLGDRWACASKNEKVLAWQPLPEPYQPKEEIL